MILKPVSLDTNIINYCVENGISAELLLEILRNRGYTPVIGVYVIYELSRTFTALKVDQVIKPENIVKAQNIFGFIKKLSPHFCCRRDHLFKQECDYLTTGKPVEFFSGHYMSDILKKRINDYCDGVFPKDHDAFIKKRQFELNSQCKNIFTYQGLRKSINVRYPNGFQEVSQQYLKDFIDNKRNVIENLQKFIYISTGPRVILDNASVIKLANNIDSYPGIKSAVFSNLYIQYLTEIDRNTPSEDRFTDFLILTESSYCAAIMSNDNTLITKHVENINPNIEQILGFDFFQDDY